MDRKRVLEIALTVLVAILLLVAAEGRHPYGFYMVLRTAATVGAAYWAVQGVPRGATGLDVGFSGGRASVEPDPAGTDAPGAVATH